MVLHTKGYKIFKIFYHQSSGFTARSKTKGDDGVWSYTLTAKKSDEIVYKFLLDGAWLADPNAPETMDDGFGGKNGMVPVASLLAAASGDTSALAAKKGPKFQTWSMLGAQAKYRTVGALDTTKKGMDLDTVGIGLKSYWKFSGYAVDKVPIYIEVALAENEGFSNLYAKDVTNKVTLSGADGFKNMITDLFFDPFYWLGGQKLNDPVDEDHYDAVKATGWAYLGHFKTM